MVIKRILPASSADPTFVRMFVAEAKILGMLNHPNVVQAYDFGEADGTLFLVLEYADGPSLFRAMQALRVAGRVMPVVIAAHFAHEICRALDYVHRLHGSDGEPMRVVHRDVTPSNIVLTSAGALKLLDFGVARYSASAAFSEHGAIRGKAAYLAPEALRGDPIDGRVDIFSLGVVLHEMLTLTGSLREREQPRHVAQGAGDGDPAARRGRAPRSRRARRHRDEGAGARPGASLRLRGRDGARPERVRGLGAVAHRSDRRVRARGADRARAAAARVAGAGRR